jgi:hypothetical protein
MATFETKSESVRPTIKLGASHLVQNIKEDVPFDNNNNHNHVPPPCTWTLSLNTV